MSQFQYPWFNDKNNYLNLGELKMIKNMNLIFLLPVALHPRVGLGLLNLIFKLNIYINS